MFYSCTAHDTRHVYLAGCGQHRIRDCLADAESMKAQALDVGLDRGVETGLLGCHWGFKSTNQQRRRAVDNGVFVGNEQTNAHARLVQH